MTFFWAIYISLESSESHQYKWIENIGHFYKKILLQNGWLMYTKFWKRAKYKNGKLPVYFNNMFEALPEGHHPYELRRRDSRFPVASTIAVSQSPRFVIPKKISKLSDHIKSRFSTHSLQSTANFVKSTILETYNVSCTIEGCYICNRPESETT